MEFVIEALIDLIMEGSLEISSNRNFPKWLRYPLIALIILIFSIVIIGLFVLGVAIIDESLWAGIFFIVVSIVFLICSILKFNKIYFSKTDEK